MKLDRAFTGLKQGIETQAPHCAHEAGWAFLRYFLISFALAPAMIPVRVSACAACFGQSDSPMAKGMNMGIFSLLFVVVFVLGGIAAFFIYLAKRSVTVAAANRLSQSLPQESSRLPSSK